MHCDGQTVPQELSGITERGLPRQWHPDDACVQLSRLQSVWLLVGRQFMHGQPDFRVGYTKALQGSRQKGQQPCCRSDAESQPLGCAAEQAAGHLQTGLHLVEDFARTDAQCRACLGELHATLGSVKQPSTELAFECLDRESQW